MGANLQFFNLTGGSSGGGVTDVTATPPLTSSGGTTPDISTSMNTNRLIGRSSANVGVMEEIQVGDGLTLSGGVLTNTATPTPTGYYGTFQDNQNQNATLNDTGFAMIFRQTILSNGVSIVSNGTSLTRITFANTGIYNLQFSSQFENTDNEQHYVTIWLRKNGNDVPESSSIFTLPPRKNASTYGQLIPAWNFVFQAIGGDYFEIVWSTNDYTKVSMPTLPATAYAPIVPSVILTATQQAGIMAGTGITALNGLTPDVQTFATGETGMDFNISSSGSTHTFNIPSASNLARGLVSIIAQTFAGVKTFLSAPILDSLTASRILATNGSKAVQSLDTTTYPDLTELSYVKGVTSAIQTQLNSKISVSKSILIGNHGASTIATGVTSYGGFVKNNLTTAAQSFNVRTIMPAACVFRNWSVQIGTQPATGSCVFTMQIDAVDTAYTLTIAAGSVTGVYQNTIGSLNVANASAITYKITNNASTSTGAVVAVSIQVEI